MAKVVNSRIRLVMSILLLLTLSTSIMGKTIYVNDDAAGTNDGSSWENAYVYLQDALADANSAEKPAEIHVAQGIYKPDQGANQTPGDREATFQLINNVIIKGGFAGGELDVRDVDANETILSGDLNNDDVEVANPVDLWDEPTRAENSYHVVTGNLTDETAVLEGFVITGGKALGSQLVDKDFDEFRLQHGGGMYNWEGNPTLTNCTFRGNYARHDGGGMYNHKGSPTLTNCTFNRNRALNSGGMSNDDNSNPILTNCTFHENSADLGGGMGNRENSSPTLINCTFSGNSTARWKGERSGVGGGSQGGGMCNSGSSPILTNCTFSGNHARNTGNFSPGDGGGMYNGWNSKPTLTNCTFSGNSAGYGGGMYNDWNTNPILANCTFNGNHARGHGPHIPGGGGGMYNSGGSPTLTNCTFAQNSAENGNALAWNSYEQRNPSNVELINCILWDGGNEIWNNDGSTIIVAYSNVQDGFPSEGNIDVDPLFADPGYWADVNDPNIVIEPNDPNAVWIDGDYHLKSESGRWDPVSESWVVDDVTSPCIDAGDPNILVGDEPDPNGDIINMGAYGGTAEASLSPAGAEQIVYIQWLGHSSVKVWTEDCIVYVDPQSLSISPHDATLVCVTHTHGDHYSPSDIARVSNAQTQFIAPPDVVQRYGSGQTIAPGQTIEFDFFNVKAVPAYNTNKPNHPKSNNWVGFIIELGGKRIYVAGDTDLIDEMKSLGDINVAFLPAGGTYTMNATEAAEATEYIKPDLAIPYHWGRNVGTLRDAETFAELARCAVTILSSGETISSDNWPEYSPLIAHWALDETEGDIAHDSAGENHSMLSGDPVWQPAGGMIDGALQLDGIDDYVSTDFVLEPADGAFSVFAWIKGGAPGQVVISQTDGTGSGETWLGADPLLGQLMTGLVPPPAGRFVLQPLVSDSVVTGDQWYHVGFVWDGSYRTLYMDGTEVAKDAAAQNPLKSSDGGMYIGAGKNLEAGTFFSGPIDDVRIYNVALTADEIEKLVR